MSTDRRERKPDRRRALLLVLLAAAVVAIPGRLAWSMRASTMASTDDAREQVRRLNEQIAQARRDQARSGELNDQLQALGAAMPADPDLPSAVEQLQALANEANVTFVATAQTPPSAGKEAAASVAAATTTTSAAKSQAKGVAQSGSSAPSDEEPATAPSSSSTSFLLEVDVAGTASNLTAYLEKIRSLPRLLTIERLAWTWQEGVAGGAGTQTVNAHFTVKAYSWPSAPRAVPGAPSTTPGRRASAVSGSTTSGTAGGAP